MRAAGISTPGWEASLALQFAPRGSRTELTRRVQRGPLVVQRPFHPEGEVCHLYLLHPPGGIVGGDRLDLGLEVAGSAKALLTTPGATKIYRSGGATAQVNQRLAVESGGALEWLPQESIVFDGARLTQRTRIEVADGGTLIAWDILCLGRPASAERFTQGQLDLGLEVRQADGPRLIERLFLGDGQGFDGPTRLRGQAVVGTLLALPATSAELALVRDEAMSPSARHGATLVDRLLVVRWLGADTAAARRDFLRLWERLRPRLMGRTASVPRIWAT